MKRILITGKNSYIGKSVEKWLRKDGEEYHIDTVSLRNDDWTNTSFSGYDVVFHVAGIAHVSRDPSLEDMYYQVNRDLTLKCAEKAKLDGVGQFIFMSSIIIYGDCKNVNGLIDNNTIPNPIDFYGKSKLMAENAILKLSSETFSIAVIRPPMIYGKNSKGNYRKLSKLAQLAPLFPNFENKRSMLHIDNLCEFIRLIIYKNKKGIFFPQNREFVNTGQLVKTIARIHGRRVFLVKGLSFFITYMKRYNIINKVFGDLMYEMSMSDYPDMNYQIRSFDESIELTEK